MDVLVCKDGRQLLTDGTIDLFINALWQIRKTKQKRGNLLRNKQTGERNDVFDWECQWHFPQKLYDERLHSTSSIPTIQEFGAKLFRSFFEIALTLANATKAPKS